MYGLGRCVLAAHVGLWNRFIYYYAVFFASSELFACRVSQQLDYSPSLTPANVTCSVFVLNKCTVGL